MTTIYNGGFKQTNGFNGNIYKIIQDYECFTEVPFTYLKDNNLVYGIIDLLLIKDGKVFIVDYKTDKDVSTNHAEQLKAYQTALKEIANLESVSYIYNINIK